MDPMQSQKAAIVKSQMPQSSSGVGMAAKAAAVPHPLKKQLLQHLMNSYMKTAHASPQEAVSGLKDIMGAYKSASGAIDEAMPSPFGPSNSAGYIPPSPQTASTINQGVQNGSVNFEPNTYGGEFIQQPQGAPSARPPMPQPNMIPQYSPQGGNSQAAMAMHYGPGGPQTPPPQTPPPANVGQGME